MKSINMSNVQESGTGESLNAGGYVCKYTNVSDVPEKEYLYMEFDIVEGPNKGYYKSLEERAGFWGGRCYRSYKEKALPMFKRMCSAVSKSNMGFVFDGDQNADEKSLIGKYVGIVLVEEEYEKNNGDIGTRLNVAYECEVDKIRSGNFKVPAKKCLAKTATANDTTDFMNVAVDDPEGLPFK